MTGEQASERRGRQTVQLGDRNGRQNGHTWVGKKKKEQQNKGRVFVQDSRERRLETIVTSPHLETHDLIISAANHGIG